MAYTSISLQDVMNHLVMRSKVLRTCCAVQTLHPIYERAGISYMIQPPKGFPHRYFMPIHINRGSYEAIMSLTEEVKTLDESLDLWLNGEICL